VVDALHDDCGVVADDLGVAEILIGLWGSNIENAVAKRSKCDRGVAKITLVGEHHLQDCDVTNDRRRDCGDEEENGSDEEEEGADMVKESSFCHLD